MKLPAVAIAVAFAAGTLLGVQGFGSRHAGSHRFLEVLLVGIGLGLGFSHFCATCGLRDVLDVAQGDSILVISPKGSTLLIDGGGAFEGFRGREEHFGRTLEKRWSRPICGREASRSWTSWP